MDQFNTMTLVLFPSVATEGAESVRWTESAAATFW